MRPRVWILASLVVLASVACTNLDGLETLTSPSSTDPVRARLEGFLFRTGSVGCRTGCDGFGPVTTVGPEPNGEFLVRAGDTYTYDIYVFVPRVAGRTVRTVVTQTWEQEPFRTRVSERDSGAIGSTTGTGGGGVSSGFHFPMAGFGLEDGVWRLGYELVESGPDLPEPTVIQREWIFRPQ